MLLVFLHSSCVDPGVVVFSLVSISQVIG